MGTRIEPPELCNHCPPCWDANETPKFVWVMFSGVSKGNPLGSEQVPNGHIFKLDIDLTGPCYFSHNMLGAGWRLMFFRSAMTAKWWVSLYYGPRQHFSGSRPGCPSEFDVWNNLYVDPNVSFGYGGVATVWWGSIVEDTADLLNIPVEPGTFYEVFLKDESKIVLKFANLNYRLNQTIELS